MKILAIDTTAEWGSIALLEDMRTLDETLLHATDGFGHVLFSEISSQLSRNGLSIADIDLFACATGPGSFTGVRVGLAAAKGLAETLGRPLVGVSNLKAMASFGTAELRAVFMDARRGEIFGAVYDSLGNAVVEESVAPLSDWLLRLPQGVEFISRQTSASTTEPPASASGAPASTTEPRASASGALAAAIGRIALQQSPLPDIAAVDANYVRRSDAELFWRD